MKNLIRTLLAGAALVVALGLAPAAAPAAMGGGEGHGPEMMARHLKKMAQELGLNQQQKQQVREILEKNKPQLEPLMKKIRDERMALHTAIHADTLDEAAVRAQAAKVAAVQADLAVEHARTAQEVRKVLTPEQQQKFRDLQARHGAKGGMMPCGGEDCGNCNMPRKKHRK